MPRGAVRQGWRNQRFASLGGEPSACQGQELFAEAVGEQAVATDAHEAFWQHVEEEAAQEADGVEGHDALLAAVCIIAPAEADALTVKGGEAVIADGHAVGVAAQVAQDMFGAAEERLGIDVPFLVAQLLDQSLEPGRITELSGRPLRWSWQRPARNFVRKTGRRTGTGSRNSGWLVWIQG